MSQCRQASFGFGIGKGGFVDIKDVDDWLGSEEVEVGDCLMNNIFVQMNRGTSGKIVTQLLQVLECTARLGVGLGFFG